jgi:DNA-binding protein H-NS
MNLYYKYEMFFLLSCANPNDTITPMQVMKRISTRWLKCQMLSGCERRGGGEIQGVFRQVGDDVVVIVVGFHPGAVSACVANFEGNMDMSKRKEETHQGATQVVQPVICGLSLEELVLLKADVESRISQKQKEAKRVIHGQMLAMAQSAGFASVEEFLGGQTGKRTRSDKGVRNAPKYRNSADTKQTWSGKGRKPGWVVAHLDAGGQLADLEIG